MKLGINAIGTRHSGAATVLNSFVEGLLTLDGLEKIFVFLSPVEKNPLLFQCSEKLELVECPAITGHPVLRYIWLQFMFDRYVRDRQCHSVINLNNFAGRLTVPQVLLIQQSLYFSREALRAFSAPGMSILHRLRIMVSSRLVPWFMKQSCRRCTHVVVQTYTMKDSLKRWFSIPETKLSVIYPARPVLPTPDRPSARLETMRHKKPCLLYVGNDSPYKNLKTLIAAAQRALQEGRVWNFFLTVDRTFTQLPDNVFLLGHLNHVEMAEAYSLADVLIQPSLVETVGLPMLEAMAADTPVVAADKPYAHEICGPAAAYFEPESPDSLFLQLDDVLAKRAPGGSSYSRNATSTLLRYPDAGEHATKWVSILKNIRRPTARVDCEQ